MVPAGYDFPAHRLVDGLIEQAQATLLAARFQMEANGHVALCVETRLVQVEVIYQYSTREIGVTVVFVV